MLIYISALKFSELVAAHILKKLIETYLYCSKTKMKVNVGLKVKNNIYFYNTESYVKLVSFVEGDPKAPFTIATIDTKVYRMAQLHTLEFSTLPLILTL